MNEFSIKIFSILFFNLNIFLSNANIECNQEPIIECKVKDVMSFKSEQDIKFFNKAYFAAGCFWGVEAIYKDLNGVISTKVGYMNGNTDNPSYKSICYDDTNHAEVVEVTFNERIIKYEDLCRVFWRLHDPTTLNRQGPDIGTQYRSGIFYLTDIEKNIALNIKKESQKYWNNNIVTEIVPAKKFYEAEEYHQDYFNKNGISNSGCHFLRNWN